jgi:hypothetical protein
MSSQLKAEVFDRIALKRFDRDDHYLVAGFTLKPTEHLSQPGAGGRAENAIVYDPAAQRGKARDGSGRGRCQHQEQREGRECCADPAAEMTIARPH